MDSTKKKKKKSLITLVTCIFSFEIQKPVCTDPSKKKKKSFQLDICLVI